MDVDGFLQDHQVYTREYLESVQPAHRNPTKASVAGGLQGVCRGGLVLACAGSEWSGERVACAPQTHKEAPGRIPPWK